MRTATRLAAALLLAVAGASAGGCVVAAVAVGAAAAYGVVKYTENEAYRDFDASLDATWTATIGALRENGYAVADSAEHGSVDGRIEIGDADVKVERRPGEYTRVHVRIGNFDTDDHRRRAALILEDVADRLE